MDGTQSFHSVASGTGCWTGYVWQLGLSSCSWDPKLGSANNIVAFHNWPKQIYPQNLTLWFLFNKIQACHICTSIAFVDRPSRQQRLIAKAIRKQGSCGAEHIYICVHVVGTSHVTWNFIDVRHKLRATFVSTSVCLVGSVPVCDVKQRMAIDMRGTFTHNLWYMCTDCGVVHIYKGWFASVLRAFLLYPK